MPEKIYVWGDSIAKGIVFDPQRGRYVNLREKSGFAKAAQELGVVMENHAHFGMTSEKGVQVLENGIGTAEKEKPVQAEEVLDRQIRPVSQSCDADRIKVEKPVSHVPRKAAIDYTVPVP